MKLVFVLLVAALSCTTLYANDELTKLDETIAKAAANIEAIRLEGPHWNLYAHLGPPYVSQYYLFLCWLEEECPAFDTKKFTELLLSEQCADGSWYAVKDANLKSGELDSTIQNYWALKAMGQDPQSQPMKRARDFVLKNGGIEKATMLVKVQLALFGQFSWRKIPQIPLALFYDWMPINDAYFGQWIGPHLLPIAYFRKQKLSKELGPKFNLDELRTGETVFAAQPKEPSPRLSKFMDTMLKRQQPRGSWGGYTVATLFCLAALSDFAPAADSSLAARINQAKRRALKYVETEYLHNDEAYRGVTMDGRYWDSALLLQALSESGKDAKSMVRAGEYLRTGIDENTGGFCFGEDFWYAPDTDDTAEIILALSPLVKADESFQDDVTRAVDWVVSMQNKDGGWGAFARNNNGNVLIRWVAKDFEDSADLFDDSSEDVTGHVLEALGHQGLTIENSDTVRQGVEYLRDKVDSELGCWFGRWGINYIYGTNAALGGLLAVGVDKNDSIVKRGLDWLEEKQNDDGGFGESTRSYIDKKFAGVGLSTPSQTAWALTALVAGGRAKGHCATKAAAYLMDEMAKKGRWIDQSTVGTGHPRIVYMNYPAYPYAFPLIALARYKEAITDNHTD